MSNVRLIDTHSHLDLEEFQENFDSLLSKIKEVGVEKVIIPGVVEKDFDRIINLIEKYDNLYGAIAVHPSEAKDWNDNSYENLKKYASHPKVVAIGETGLDYYWDKTFVEMQQFLLKEHIRIAKELQKPLIIHDREAHFDTLRILKESNIKDIGGVMHCFSGSVEFAQECIKEGLYIALGGPVTFKNAQKPKEVAQSIPIEKLLLETDSPYLTPHPFRGKLNDSSNIILVAEKIAELRNIPLQKLADITTDNAVRLFKF